MTDNFNPLLLDEYSRKRVQRIVAEAKAAKKALADLIDGVYLTNVCRYDQFKTSPIIYKEIETFLKTFPNIKSKRRYLAAIQQLKEENCNGQSAD